MVYCSKLCFCPLEDHFGKSIACYNKPQVTLLKGPKDPVLPTPKLHTCNIYGGNLQMWQVLSTLLNSFFLTVVAVMISDSEVFDDFVFATTQILYDFDGFRFVISAWIFLENGTSLDWIFRIKETWMMFSVW